ncbi:alpha-xenorhabdolysin family binary toxin subunit B [Pseudomonas sp.]|uniref:alpha-xenorhabdolysin family binary toxin subunit B n=1 Tax=Pseudomonas sp. TaxID=306 RepID=UPI0028A8F7A7|nr:alpha-xenorhabdolysin family binary toxin subunit B [Pseudomonas sp.]
MNDEHQNSDIPDVKTLLTTEARIRSIYHTETSGLLPAVRESLMDLVSLVADADKTLRNQILEGLVLLNNELDEHTVSSEEKSYDADLLRLRTSIQASAERITGGIRAVDVYRHPELSSLKKDLEEKRQMQEAAVAQAQLTIDSREAQWKEIHESLAILSKPSISKLIKSQLPSDQELEITLKTFTDPSVTPELLKAAVNRLNKNIDLVKQGRELAKLSAASNKLAAALDEERRVLKRLKEGVALTQEQLAEFDSADSLVELRQTWLTQANVFVDRWQSLEGLLVSAIENDQLFAALKSVRDYFLAVRRGFEKG